MPLRPWRWLRRGGSGCGHAPRTATAATASRVARDLDRMIEAFDLAGACFVGHSMGALTLWQYLCDFGSSRIGALCLIEVIATGCRSRTTCRSCWRCTARARTG